MITYDPAELKSKVIPQSKCRSRSRLTQNLINYCCSEDLPFKKLHKISSTTCRVLLPTDRQTDTQPHWTEGLVNDLKRRKINSRIQCSRRVTQATKFITKNLRLASFERCNCVEYSHRHYVAKRICVYAHSYLIHCTSRTATNTTTSTTTTTDIHPRLSFVGWHRSCVPSWRMYAGYRRRPLQSADNQTYLVKRSCNQFSDRCFATAGPTLWNSLLEHHLRTIQTIVGNVYVWLVGPQGPVSER